MQRLTSRGNKVDLQVLDSEFSLAYKKAITETWKASYQLVLPHVHRRNAAEQAIRRLKTHFLSVLDGVNTSFLGYLWNILLPQAELTLSLQLQATRNTSMDRLITMPHHLAPWVAKLSSKLRLETANHGTNTAVMASI